MLVICITTVSAPTRATTAWANLAPEQVACLVVAGDRKGPDAYTQPNTIFLSLHDQLDSGFQLARELPTGHYSRKNIAYLDALRRGATCIYETDDDNTPMPSWAPRQEYVHAVLGGGGGSAAGSKWVNVYRYFTGELIWPRGLPLDVIHGAVLPPSSGENRWRAPIQQGLVNGSPDVDAIWRLTMDRPFEFENRSSVYLGPDCWCPFNTQSTWWWPIAFPLLYIPSFCSFRMCDIWKSFIAQRCLWAMNMGVVFHSPEVWQDRNPHDYACDFRDEVPGFLQNARIAELLSGLALSPEPAAIPDNLLACYRALVEENIFPRDELNLVKVWLSDIQSLRMAPG